jgi:DNA-binding transcriptional regulator YdaS (Cro superfamily)
MNQRKEYDAGMELALDAAGGVSALARLLKILPSAVRKWRKVPDHRIVEIEKKTGVPREKLRPDLYT